LALESRRLVLVATQLIELRLVQLLLLNLTLATANLLRSIKLLDLHKFLL